MDKDVSAHKKTRKRSTSYPAFSLEEVVEATKELKEKLGDGPYSREIMATALGYKAVTGSSGMKISSCVHFGLLDRNGNTYSQSELASRLFNYLDEDERKGTLLEAFSKPSLYSKLLAEYSAKSLPLMLESILIRNYGIQENAAKAAAKNFKESAEFVGVLKNGVLNIESADSGQLTIKAPVEDSTEKADHASNDLSSQVSGKPQANFTSPINNKYLSVTLPSGLIVSYEQKLAHAFAFGVFAKELLALDKIIKDYDGPEETRLDSRESEEE
jgi:hypothetical protein